MADSQQVVRCKSCRQQIIWLKTSAGKNMPCDAATVYPADTTFDPAKHKSHFATCPNADRHRRAR